jgi:hypothetical protein
MAATSHKRKARGALSRLLHHGALLALPRLFFCLRGTRMRITAQPEDLIPKLLSSKDFQRAELDLLRSHDHHPDDKCAQ